MMNTEQKTVVTPCYCKHFSPCDFCTGMADPDGPRGDDWRQDEAQQAARMVMDRAEQQAE